MLNFYLKWLFADCHWGRDLVWIHCHSQASLCRSPQKDWLPLWPRRPSSLESGLEQDKAAGHWRLTGRNPSLDSEAAAQWLQLTRREGGGRAGQTKPRPQLPFVGRDISHYDYQVVIRYDQTLIDQILIKYWQGGCGRFAQTKPCI